MADETIVPTPAEEVKDSEPAKNEAPIEEPKEAVAEAPPEERYPEAPEEKKQPESVPLHVHTKVRDELKSEIRELRKQVAEGKSPSTAKLSQIAEKWGVEASDVQDLAAAIRTDSNREFETKLGAIEQERKMAKVNEAFDQEFAKLAKNYPQLEGKKEQLRSLAFTRAYVKSPLDQIAQDVFGDFLSKGTIEEGRPATDGPGETIDFSKPLTAEMWEKIKSDPKAKQAYYDYKNSQ